MLSRSVKDLLSAARTGGFRGVIKKCSEAMCTHGEMH